MYQTEIRYCVFFSNRGPVEHFLKNLDQLNTEQGHNIKVLISTNVKPFPLTLLNPAFFGPFNPQGGGADLPQAFSLFHDLQEGLTFWIENDPLPFRTFPKMNPIWYCQPSLTKLICNYIFLIFVSRVSFTSLSVTNSTSSPRIAPTTSMLCPTFSCPSGLPSASAISIYWVSLSIWSVISSTSSSSTAFASSVSNSSILRPTSLY